MPTSKKYLHKFRLEVYHYCLIPTHLHFSLKIFDREVFGSVEETVWIILTLIRIASEYFWEAKEKDLTIDYKLYIIDYKMYMEAVYDRQAFFFKGEG